MSKSLILAGALALGTAFGATAADLTVDEVIARNIEAKGGAQAWENVNSAHMTGKMVMGGGMEAPFRIWFSRPEQVRMEFDFQGMTGVQAFDGEQGWFVMPFMGKPDPELMAEDQLKDIQEMADFDGDLMNYEEKGHEIEYLGMEEVDGTDAHVLKVSKKNGDESTLYLDADAFIEFKQTAKTTRQGNPVVVDTIFGDYKEVDGVMLAHSLEATVEGMPMSQVISIEEITINPTIDGDKYSMPATVEAAEE